MDLLAGSHDTGSSGAVDVHGGIVLFAQADKNSLAAVGSQKGHGTVGFSFEIAIRENTVDLGLQRGGKAFAGRSKGFGAFEKG